MGWLPSSITGKSIVKVLLSPSYRSYSTSADEDYKGAGHMLEHLTSPWGSETSPEKSPMMLAFGSDEGVWSWFERPFNTHRLRRFGVAMEGVNSTQPSGALLKGTISQA